MEVPSGSAELLSFDLASYSDPKRAWYTLSAHARNDPAIPGQ